MSAQGDFSDDAAIGGRLVLRQPRRGHRFGHDSILLAAATQALAGEHAVELGAGVGAAGLALARRVAGLTVTLVEIDPALAGLARDNALRNGLGERVRAVCLDVAGPAGAFAAASSDFSADGVASASGAAARSLSVLVGGASTGGEGASSSPFAHSSADFAESGRVAGGSGVGLAGGDCEISSAASRSACSFVASRGASRAIVSSRRRGGAGGGFGSGGATMISTGISRSLRVVAEE